MKRAQAPKSARGSPHNDLMVASTAVPHARWYRSFYFRIGFVFVVFVVALGLQGRLEAMPDTGAGDVQERPLAEPATETDRPAENHRDPTPEDAGVETDGGE